MAKRSLENNIIKKIYTINYHFNVENYRVISNRKFRVTESVLQAHSYFLQMHFVSVKEHQKRSSETATTQSISSSHRS